MKVLVTSTSFGKQVQAPLEKLQKFGYDLVFNTQSHPLKGQELIELLADCDGVIAGLDYYTADVIAACPKLKVIARYGVGYDRVDLAAAREAGIVVTNTPEANSNSVADLAVALMLAVGRHIPQANADTRAGGWGKFNGISLTGKTVGLLGFGRIGQRVARRVQGFDCPVIAYDPFLSEEFMAGLNVVKCETIDDVLRQADFISLHLPANDQTRGCINAEKLALMKPTAILVNTARGEVVDEPALVQAVKSKTIGGAGLDVFATEPIDLSLYQDVDQIVLTPHIAAHSEEALYNMGMGAVENLSAVLAGKEPINPVK